MDTKLFAERIKPTLEWLDAGAPHGTEDRGFNMETFIDYADEDHPVEDWAFNTCGTTCCIAGHVVLFNKVPTNCRRPDGTFIDTMQAAADYLGLDQNEAEGLFFGVPFVALSEITPAQAAQVIRHAIETGTIDWSISKGTK